MEPLIIPIVGRVYRHFKGGEYVVQSIDRDADTQEIRVSYFSVDDATDSWSRLLSHYSFLGGKFAGWADPLPDGSARFTLVETDE